jgi:hypothetical protein
MRLGRRSNARCRNRGTPGILARTSRSPPDRRARHPPRAERSTPDVCRDSTGRSCRSLRAPIARLHRANVRRVAGRGQAKESRHPWVSLPPDTPSKTRGEAGVRKQSTAFCEHQWLRRRHKRSRTLSIDRIRSLREAVEQRKLGGVRICAACARRSRGYSRAPRSRCR